MADVGFYRTNSDGDACTTDSRESYNALSCYESISATVSQNLVGWNMMLVIPARKITLMIVCVGINSRALKITIFARLRHKVFPKPYNLALLALL
ncbi:hypothetical protein DMI69_06360 [Escherichia coli]|nr:hypothetical protein [Escherichia coli]